MPKKKLFERNIYVSIRLRQYMQKSDSNTFQYVMALYLFQCVYANMFKKSDSNQFKCAFADEKNSTWKIYSFQCIHTNIRKNLIQIHLNAFLKEKISDSIRLSQDMKKIRLNPFQWDFAEKKNYYLKKSFPSQYVYAKTYENQIQIRFNAFLPI